MKQEMCQVASGLVNWLSLCNSYIFTQILLQFNYSQDHLMEEIELPMFSNTKVKEKVTLNFLMFILFKKKRYQ